MDTLAEYVDGLPSLCGQEQLIREAIEAGRRRPVFPAGANTERAVSTFAVALHMHQPLIPADGDDLRSARIISNLAWMMAHPDLGDSHNARVFAWCYKRMGEFIGQLGAEDDQFGMEGGSWTSDISWTRGYDNVLTPWRCEAASPAT